MWWFTVTNERTNQHSDWVTNWPNQKFVEMQFFSIEEIVIQASNVVGKKNSNNNENNNRDWANHPPSSKQQTAINF